MNRITALFLVFLLIPIAASADINRQDIYDKIDKLLVTVDYKAEMTFMGQSEDIEGRVLGISTGPDGLVIFDGTTLGSGFNFGGAMGSPRVEKPKSLKVTDYQGNTYEAEFIGIDQYSSIAFCRLPDSARGSIGQADFKYDQLALGDDVYIFWLLPENYSPRFQMGTTEITGVLSQPEPFFLTGELTSEFVLAPVVSLSGDIIGVITPFGLANGNYSPYDYGTVFGIPMGIMPQDEFRKLLQNPPELDKDNRGWLGISLQALDPEIAEFWGLNVKGGIIVSDVIKNSPAEKAGLKAGDFLVALDGKDLTIAKDANLTVFQKTVSDLGAGTKLELTTIRPTDSGLDTLTLFATLEDVPLSASDAESYEDKNFDMTIRNLVFSDYNNRNIDPDKVKGVMVDKMEAGGWAAVAGVNPGDIITMINDKAVTNVAESKAIFEQMEKDKTKDVVFMIWNRNKTRFVNVKTHWK